MPTLCVSKKHLPKRSRKISPSCGTPGKRHVRASLVKATRCSCVCIYISLSVWAVCSSAIPCPLYSISYDSVLHTKFRFRSATFFKSSRLELACEKHKDRVLITGLRTKPTEPPQPPSAPPFSIPPAVGASSTASDPTSPRSDDGASEGVSKTNDRKLSSSANFQGEGEGSSGKIAARRLLMVVNCHLTGGPAPERRLRQVFDALETARKEANRLLVEEESSTVSNGSTGGGNNSNKGRRKKGTRAAPTRLPTSVPVVICGDFNSDGPTAVSELLKKGVVEASFRELGYLDVRTARI